MSAYDVEALRHHRNRCIVKAKTQMRATSFATTTGGRSYVGAMIESETNLLAISSEQSALVQSTAANDFPVRSMVTMATGDALFTLSPIVVKLLIDYRMRTQHPLLYQVIDDEEKTLFQIDDVLALIPWYQPAPIVLARTSQPFSSNVFTGHNGGNDIETVLRRYAREGIQRNFPLYDGASGYGAAVMTASGTIFCAGQYSSPDNRLGLHAEMVAMIAAFMHGETEIVALGVMSSKHTEAPCDMCGMCRQFFSEMAVRFRMNAEIFCFASENDMVRRYHIDDYLPSAWTATV